MYRLTILQKFRYIAFLVLYYALLPLIWVVSMFNRKNFIDNTINYVFFFYPNLVPYIISQSKFETGNYESPACKQYKNLFGMNKASVRPQVMGFLWSGEYANNQGVAYKSYFQSAYDMYLYLSSLPEWSSLKSIKGSSGLTFYVGMLQEHNYFTADVVTYQQGVGAIYQTMGTTKSKVLFMFKMLVVVGVSLTLLYYIIRYFRKLRSLKNQKKT